MAKVNISLVDNDFVVHARVEVSDRNRSLWGLFQHLDEDFIRGEDAFIEIEGLKKGPVRLIVSQVDG